MKRANYEQQIKAKEQAAEANDPGAKLLPNRFVEFASEWNRSEAFKAWRRSDLTLAEWRERYSRPI